MLTGYEHLIGGLAGGAASTMVCHPFDLLKIRFSANEGSPNRPQYGGYWRATRTIVKSGGVRALYQGLSPSIIAAPLSWGLYFHLFHHVRSALERFSGDGAAMKEYPLLVNLMVGCATGALVLGITNPLWVCKTRLCLQYEGDGGGKRYTGLWNCLGRIRREEGFRGYYKGFAPGLIGTTNGSIQFAIYNWLKEARCRRLGVERDAKLSTTDYLFFSTLSKVFSTLATFPYQVMRTRLQDHHTTYRGLWDCLVRTVRGEGLSGLYKGLLPATAKQLPNSIVTYVVYEHTQHLMKSL